MQTSKKWEMVDNTVFALWDNLQQIGTMKIARGTFERKATVSFQGREFQIKKTGFWKNSLEITDQNGEIIAKVYPEKWYTSSYILEYGTKSYKLVVRNNPLAEWALQEDGQDLLAYGLTTKDGKPTVKITNTVSATNYLFDFILWYLFVSIATEQGADDMTFLMMIA